MTPKSWIKNHPPHKKKLPLKMASMGCTLINWNTLIMMEVHTFIVSFTHFWSHEMMDTYLCALLYIYTGNCISAESIKNMLESGLSLANTLLGETGEVITLIYIIHKLNVHWWAKSGRGWLEFDHYTKVRSQWVNTKLNDIIISNSTWTYFH